MEGHGIEYLFNRLLHGGTGFCLNGGYILQTASCVSMGFPFKPTNWPLPRSRFLCKNAQKGSRMIHYDGIEHNITIIADVEAFLSVLTGWVF